MINVDYIETIEFIGQRLSEPGRWEAATYQEINREQNRLFEESLKNMPILGDDK